MILMVNAMVPQRIAASIALVASHMTSQSNCLVNSLLRTQLIQQNLMVSMVFRLCSSNAVTCTILPPELQIQLYMLHGTKLVQPILILPMLQILTHRMVMVNNNGHLLKRHGMVLIFFSQPEE